MGDLKMGYAYMESDLEKKALGWIMHAATAENAVRANPWKISTN